LAVLAMAVPDWIEEVSGLHPDGGEGTTEWAIALAFLAVAMAGFALASREAWWTRAHSRP
jgi:hypothetical protein